MKIKTCPICLKVFNASHGQVKYCSVECAHQRNKAFEKRGICRICGAPCKTGNTRCGKCKSVAGIKRRICPICGKPKRGQAKNCRNCANKLSRKPKGEGRYKTKDGYIYVYMPEHPRVVKANNNSTKRRQSLAEHIVIWEQVHGKLLPMDWIIHHLNGIRNDNRIENLLAMPQKDHGGWTFVKALQKRIRELEQLRFNL